MNKIYEFKLHTKRKQRSKDEECAKPNKIYGFYGYVCQWNQKPDIMNEDGKKNTFNKNKNRSKRQIKLWHRPV